MVWFLLSLIGLVVCIATVIILKVLKKKKEYDGVFSVPVLSILAAICAVVLACQCFYMQDAGDVKVIRNFGGSIAGSTADPGIHLKAPWQDVITYDVRNNVITFANNANEDYLGGSATGPQITVNDKGGASANIDLQVNYSLDPSVATMLYEDYGTQEAFVRAIVGVDSRAIPRQIAGQFDTVSILTNRGEFTKAIEDALTEKWEKYGLNVEQVSVQEVRYPETITSRYSEAQAAEIAKSKALNEQEAKKVEAETRVIEAQGIADANQVLTESLTDEVLQQKYIDALVEIGKNGNLVVVPENSQPIVNTGNSIA